MSTDMANLVALIALSLGYIELIVATKESKFGPYTTTLTSVRRCEKTSHPEHQNPPLTLHLEVYNPSRNLNLLRGNLTVNQVIQNTRIQVKAYKWEGKKWKIIHIITNLGCRGRMLPSVFTAMGIGYDQANCFFLKGFYQIKETDVNKLQHMFYKTREYGKTMWRNELHNGARTFYCWEIEIVISPELH